jgi:hypothetical protein
MKWRNSTQRQKRGCEQWLLKGYSNTAYLNKKPTKWQEEEMSDLFLGGDRVISDPLKLRQHIKDSGQEFVWQVYFAQSLSIFRHRLRSDRSWRMST